MGIEASSNKAILKKTFKEENPTTSAAFRVNDKIHVVCEEHLSTEERSKTRMRVFEAIHHLIKAYSVTKWFLAVEERAIEILRGKKPLVLCSFGIHKPLHGRVLPHTTEQGIYSQEITGTNLW